MNMVWGNSLHHMSSIAVPGILIRARGREDFNRADSSLASLADSTVGVNLLNEILRHSCHGREVTVFVTRGTNSNTVPKPTQQQMNRLGVYHSDNEQLQIEAARPLALKGRFLKGEGTSATVYWNPDERTPTLPRHMHVTSDRQPLNSELTLVGIDSNRTVVGGTSTATLAHELVHAMRIVKGTYTDDLTDEGKSNEERRALGVMEYANDPISENAYRREQQLPLRAWYPSV